MARLHPPGGQPPHITRGRSILMILFRSRTRVVIDDHHKAPSSQLPTDAPRVPGKPDHLTGSDRGRRRCKAGRPADLPPQRAHGTS